MGKAAVLPRPNLAFGLNSFNVAWSSRDSASSRFKRPFSSSSAFSRFVSDTSIPANLAFLA